MAAYDDSLLNSEGQTWSLWAENIGFSSTNSDLDDEEATKSNQEKATTRLSKDEMSIYGYCPRWEDFYLVVCSICGQAIKPQALRQHTVLRHGDGEDIKFTSGNSSKFSRSSSRSTKSQKLKPISFDKFEEKVNIEETYRENSLSPINALTHERELQTQQNITFKTEIECNRNLSSLNRSSESVATSGCDFLSMTQVSPLMQMSLKGETLEDSLFQSHLSPSCSLPHRLPPPVPPEPQHILPPPSPHAGPPPSIGPPTPTLATGNCIGPLTPGRRPPTPGMGPPTPGLGPPTPGMGPPTPGMGPPTPGMGPPTPGIGPLTPGMGPQTPVMGSQLHGMGPPTPGMGPQTPGISPLTPGLGPQTPGMGPLTPGVVPLPNQATPTHGQSGSMCPLYSAQTQSLRSVTPTMCQNQSVSPLTPTHIAHSPSLEHSVPSIGTQTPSQGRPPTPGLSPLPSSLVSQVQLIGPQSVTLGAQSPNLSLPLAVGSDSLNGPCLQAQTGPQIIQEDIRGLTRQSSLPSPDVPSEQDEVNRISAMLMKEAEALTAPQSYHSDIREAGGNALHSSVPSHDIVEAQGLAGGGMRRGPLLSSHLTSGTITSPSSKITLSSLPLQSSSQTVSHAITVSQPLGSVPVSMSSMSMATLKQIQADLLATVSESDLNAVLNATPDTPVLPNNSHCYRNGNNIQYSDRSVVTSDHFVESSQLNNQAIMQYSTSNVSIPTPIIDQLTDDMLSDVEGSQNIQGNSAHVIHDPYGSSHDILGGSGHTLHYIGSDKNSQNDELSRAVDSITKLCQDEANSSLESQLAGLLQQPPATATNIQSGSSVLTGLSSLSTPASQGITVVIGGGQDSATNPVSLSLTSLAASLKKPSIVSSINSSLINRSTSGSSSGSLQSIVPIELASSADQICNSNEQFVSHPVQVQEHCLPQTITPQQQNHKIQTTQISHQVQQRSQLQQTQSIQISQSQPGHYITSQTYSHHTQGQQSYQNLPSQGFQNSASLPVPPPTPSPKKSSKKKKPGERKLLPLKDREYDPEIHCGVVVKETGKPCTRSLTCKTHPLSLRRNVSGRSKKFDELLNEHKAAKEAQSKASKPSEAAATLMQNTPPRGPSGMSSANTSGHMNGPSAHMASIVGSSSTSSPLLVRTLGGTPTTHSSYVSHPDPSPTSYYHSVDPPSTPSHLQATPPSPAYWPSQRLAPPLCHSDNFFVRESPKPIAICSYNARRLGGYLSTDHKVDILRSALSIALKKPQPGIISDSSLSSNVLFSNTDRFNSVKPLLARKLQATIPSSSTYNKEGLGVSVGYNGHIQLSSSSGLIHNSALAASLKRPTQAEVVRHSSAVVSAKSKSKKIKPNDGGAINYVSNVVQLDASGNKNHFPVVTVSLPNGLTNPQTITLGNVPIASVRNATNQPIRIHPPLTVRDAQVTDTRTNTADSANIVLGSGIPGAGFVIADTIKPLKSDSVGSIRLDGSKIISKGTTTGAASSAASISLVGSSGSLSGGTTTVSSQTVPQHQVYFTAVSGGGSNTQLLQQLLNCRSLGKNTGMKFLSPNQTVTGNRQAFVLQQEKEPS